MNPPLHLRIFLSSPGDVADERALANRVIDDLPYDASLRGRVTLEIVAWDRKGAPPMEAGLSPQEAINLGLPMPSECDIVVVVLWSRMGTPLTVNGVKYKSGTHFEYEDAMKAYRKGKKPRVLVYWRTEEPHISLDDPQLDEKRAQRQMVKEFLASFKDVGSGEPTGGYKSYDAPNTFREKLEDDLRFLLEQVLRQPEREADKASTASSVPELWPGSPFPGLRAFTPADAPIFFGRGRETDALVKRVSESRFVAVVGASGSGKSSLVGAGLILRLKGNAIEGSKDWLLPEYEPGRGWSGLRFTPGELGDNPFMALAAKAAPLTGDTPRELADKLLRVPAEAITVMEQALAGRPEWAKALLYIDQFEELFTVVAAYYRQPFVEMLVEAAKSERLRTVVTMRSDFYHRCVDVPQLVGLLESGSYPLAIPGQVALYEMITRPAERAGLAFEEGLPEQILDDTGDEPGALALLAYALDELYHARKDGRLTAAAYEALGRVQGAIGRRAESTFARLNADAQAALPRVFRELVEVDERGTATRQRAARERVAYDTATERLVEAFTVARLLTTNRADERAVVEVAHEALLRSWPRLAEWVENTQDDLRLLRQVKNAAGEWDANGRSAAYLWPAERLKLVYEMQERLQPDLNDVELEFIEPEQARLLRELDDIHTQHKRRYDIGDRLSVIGDPRDGVGVRENGTPDIEWLPVTPGGEIEIKDQRFTVQPFYIAKYLITYTQFQAFVEAEDGFQRKEWWAGMPKEYQRQEVATPSSQGENYPRSNISWYQSVAFMHWLSHRLQGLTLPNTPEALVVGNNAEIRLPLEWEWQWAAQGGWEEREYPWGEWDEYPRANTYEAGIGSRSTAVGMYPHGAATCGALDAAGNLWEWCLNDYRNPRTVDYGNGQRKMLRGGSSTIREASAAARRATSTIPIIVTTSASVFGWCVGRPLLLDSEL